MVDPSFSLMRVLQKNQEVGSSKEKITCPQNQVAIAGKGSFSQEKVTSFLSCVYMTRQHCFF